MVSEWQPRHIAPVPAWARRRSRSLPDYNFGKESVDQSVFLGLAIRCGVRRKLGRGGIRRALSKLLCAAKVEIEWVAHSFPPS